MEQRITLLTLGVTNLLTSAAYYEGAFGWQRTANSTDEIVFFTLNGFQLSLYEYSKLAEDAQMIAEESSTPFKGFTLSYNVRSVEEVNALFVQLKAKGVRIQKEPQPVFWGGYSGYIADPDGYLWEIAYNPFLIIDAAGNVASV